MRGSLLIALTCTCACAGSAPPTDSAATPQEDAPRPAATSSDPAHFAPAPPAAIARPASGGRKIWEVIPNAPHGQCCESDDECGPITCEPYEYAHASCQRVCTYSCEPGDLCPVPGGTLGPPSPCPESGLCPVGSPFV